VAGNVHRELSRSVRASSCHAKDLDSVLCSRCRLPNHRHWCDRSFFLESTPRACVFAVGVHTKKKDAKSAACKGKSIFAMQQTEELRCFAEVFDVYLAKESQYAQR
jgi:hypothetical protein